MNLGDSLFNARKKCGLSQGDVAEKIRSKQADSLKMGNRWNISRYMQV